MRRLATVLLSLLMLSLVSCLGGSGDQSADTSAPSRVVMAVTADPDGLDPHMSAAASTFQVTSSIYETLVTVDAQGHIIPGLAESWQVADDGLSITFTLAEGVLFSNGDHCDAEAVKASFDRLRSSESVRSGDYAFISGVEVLDGTGNVMFGTAEFLCQRPDKSGGKLFLLFLRPALEHFDSDMRHLVSPLLIQTLIQIIIQTMLV